MFSLVPVPVAQADEGATIIVNTAADDVINNGNCTLREVIIAANLDQPVDACPLGNGPLQFFYPKAPIRCR